MWRTGLAIHLFSVRVLAGPLAGAALGQAPKPARSQEAKAAGWTLLRQVDKMTDAEDLTLVLRSVEGHASLRVHCNDRQSYIVFLTFPKTIKLTEPTLIEVRFDKKEPVGYIASLIDLDALVASIGGSKTDANYGLMTSDPAKGVRGQFSGDETGRTGAALVKEIQNSARMVYRLSLAEPAKGTEATFNLSGFNRAIEPLTKECPLPQ